MTPEHLDVLSMYKKLVDQLLGETCDEKLIKELMHKLGIEYKESQVDRLSAVLAFDPRNPIKGKMNDLR
ncbi:MAG: hypothetical protein IT287_02150 [Bdellovibrionaceae bacterium]|nr:hypothetical protein [Pseudobdellovibrionaceae bacterium]